MPSIIEYSKCGYVLFVLIIHTSFSWLSVICCYLSSQPCHLVHSWFTSKTYHCKLIWKISVWIRYLHYGWFLRSSSLLNLIISWATLNCQSWNILYHCRSPLVKASRSLLTCRRSACFWVCWNWTSDTWLKLKNSTDMWSFLTWRSHARRLSYLYCLKHLINFQLPVH